MTSVQKKSARRVEGVEDPRQKAPGRKKSTACVNQSPAGDSEKKQVGEAQDEESRVEGNTQHERSAGAIEGKVERSQKVERTLPETTGGGSEAIQKKKYKLRLNPRQSKFLEGVMAGKNQFQAAMSAGYSKTFAKHPTVLLRGRALQEAFAELMPSIERLAQGICEGISAERIEFIKLQGSITDERSHIDWQERRKYIQLATRLRGLLNQPKVNVEMNGDVQVVIEHIGGK